MQGPAILLCLSPVVATVHWVRLALVHKLDELHLAEQLHLPP